MSLATMLWPLPAACALLGCAVGGLTGPPRSSAARRTALALVAADVLAAGLAVTGLVPGRPGFWIEGGAVGLGAYLIGAGLGGAIGHRTGQTP